MIWLPDLHPGGKQPQLFLPRARICARISYYYFNQIVVKRLKFQNKKMDYKIPLGSEYIGFAKCALKLRFRQIVAMTI